MHCGPQVCYANSNDKRTCGTATRALAVVASPLVAVITGVNAIVGAAGPITVDCGKGSSDPDMEDGSLGFSWTCEGPNPDGCFTSEMAPLTFARNSPTQASHPPTRRLPLRACLSAADVVLHTQL